MSDLNGYDIFDRHILNLKELSKDDSTGEYMIESKREAIAFDAVKTDYANSLGLSEQVAESLDALISTDNAKVFIEFKNGDMKNEKRSVKTKIRDSLLIYCDIVNQSISDTRSECDFILVYNEAKNPVRDHGVVSIPESARVTISKYFIEKSGDEFIRFDLERFKKLYFREVHTYSIEEFNRYIDRISGK